MSGFAFGFGYEGDEDTDEQRPVTRGGYGRPQSRGGFGATTDTNASSQGFGFGYSRPPPDTASTYDYEGEISYVTGHGQSFTSTPVSVSASTSGASAPGAGAGPSSRPRTRGVTGRMTTGRMSDVNEEEEYKYGTYDQDIYDEEDDEEEEESEAEDVFAYLPPGTAEQQQAQLQAQAHGGPTTITNPIPSTTISPPAPAYYSPTFNYPHPYAQNISSVSITPHTSLTPAPGIPRLPISFLPVESPPQTNSSISHERERERQRSNEGYEEYRLRPMSSSVGPGSSQLGTTSLGSIPVTVSLPPTSAGEGGKAATSSSIASPPSKPKKRNTTSSRKVQTPESRDIRTATASSEYTSTSFPLSFSKAKRAFGHGHKIPKTPTTAGSGVAWASPSVSGSSYEEFGPGSSGRQLGDLEGDGSGSVKMELDFDQMGIPGEEDEDSPYPEVRASVSNIDDPEMPALTLRMWMIGLMLSILSCAANVFFTFRNPAPTIPPVVILLIAYPIGKFMAYSLPIRTYKFPSIPLPLWFPSWLGGVRTRDKDQNGRRQKFLGGWEVSLNPGPWNIKEHVLIYIMSNVTNVPPYSLNMIVVSEINYGVHRGFGFNLVLTFITQLTGFGLAGLCRRFLVWPAAMIWPSNLVVCTLLNTLHAEDDFIPPAVGTEMGIALSGSNSGLTNPSHARTRKLSKWNPKRWWTSFKWNFSPLWGGTSMTRYKFFLLVGISAFFWFFLPGYLWTGLSWFSWICWIAPDNVVVNQLFGTVTGLGMGVVTFDWTQISAWNASPLAIPWWAQCHVFLGFVLFYWILLPILYYTNVWKFSYFPISSENPYDRFGNVYNVSRVLTPEVTLNLTAYKEYSPLYLPVNYAMTYLIAFAMSTCVVVHTILNHGRSLLNGVKRVKGEADDIHAKLMRSYPEVPDWWYGATFSFFFLMAVVMVEVWHTGVPVYILILSLILPAIYILPGGFILAMTGQTIGINILAQIIPGALVPGSPIVNMLFKTYSIQTLAEAEEFIQDLKLGHYIKVPPRAVFVVQLAATAVAATVQIGVKTWLFDSVHDICDSHQRSDLTCPHNQVFFTASAIWGLIGVTRQFGKHTLYYPETFALIIGAVLPIPFWLWHRKYPNSRLPVINIPVLLTGITQIPPAVGINFSSWFATGFIFQYLIRRKNFAWWSKYNYVTSAGLDCGTFTAIIIIFFCLAYPKGGVNFNWWGNEVWQNTADFLGTPFRTAPPGGIPGT